MELRIARRNGSFDEIEECIENIIDEQNKRIKGLEQIISDLNSIVQV